MATPSPPAPGLVTQKVVIRALAARGIELNPLVIQAVCVLSRIACRKVGQLVCYQSHDLDRIEAACRAYLQVREAVLRSPDPLPAAAPAA